MREKLSRKRASNHLQRLRLTLKNGANVTSTYDHAYFSSSENNMGLVFTTQFVNQLINQHGVDFCLYDDYNWDFTLMHISSELAKPPWLVVTPSLSRLQHLGVKTCGTHIVDKKAIECDVNAIETQFNADLAAIDKQLNPAAFVEVKRPKRLFAKKPFRSGGWGDPRDLKLCLDMIHNDYVNLTLIRSMT